MEKISGRIAECKILHEALQSKESELIAVYGRRRVGKTFLVREVYRKEIVFEFTGVHNASMKMQLSAFFSAIRKQFGSRVKGDVPLNWFAAFELLKECLETQPKSVKKVLFFDEFPWIHTRKSLFLESFEHFWNTWLSRRRDVVVVICGSSASWMLQKVVHNKGGLHNRLTRRIRLMPFTLSETEQYLRSRKIDIDRYQILQLYMAFGGIPQYLKLISKGESVAQTIDRECFTRDGFLRDEFGGLYSSLFTDSTDHMKIIGALASKPWGLTRNQLIESCKIASGGTLSKLLSELEDSGFIISYIPFDKNSSDKIFKLQDEYSLFYLKFIRNSRLTGTGTWLRQLSSATWKSWSGFAFERVCLKHIAQIETSLGISGVQTQSAPWFSKGNKKASGAQIDLLIDRADHCINVCEMKYAEDEFRISSGYATELKNKLKVFKRETGSRKTLFLCFLTTYGLMPNQYTTSLVQSSYTTDILFK